MRRANIDDPTFEHDQSDPEGFRTGMARLGPGWAPSRPAPASTRSHPASRCALTTEYGEEEWLPVLRGWDGEERTPG